MLLLELEFYVLLIYSNIIHNDPYIRTEFLMHYQFIIITKNPTC